MLFSVPFRDIAFQDVEEFCQAWAEGVRVEYKSVLDSGRIPKVVSSFANTQGGIWIIGVETDTANRPKLPIRGIPLERGIEERITQACYQGLYPPLLPQIKIINVPEPSGNVVVVIQIPESVDAPHAIENSTKVYIRTNSTTDIIQLAEIDRIEYLLKRRQQPEQKREAMLAGMATRCRISPPHLRVVISPRYPWRPIFQQDILITRLGNFQAAGTYSNLGRAIRLVRDGFMSMVSSPRPDAPEYHFEINIYGVISCYVSLGVENDSIYFNHVVTEVGRALYLARHLLKDTGTNILVRVTLQNVRNLLMIRAGPGEMRSVEERIEAEVFPSLEELDDDLRFTEPVVELILQVMWSFNWADRNGIRVKTQEILQREHIP